MTGYFCAPVSMVCVSIKAIASIYSVQPDRAAITDEISSVTSTISLPSRSKVGQLSSSLTPSAIRIPLISSLTAMEPSPLQSPTQGLLAGTVGEAVWGEVRVRVAVGVATRRGVGVRVAVGVAAIGGTTSIPNGEEANDTSSTNAWVAVSITWIA